MSIWTRQDRIEILLTAFQTFVISDVLMYRAKFQFLSDVGLELTLGSRDALHENYMLHKKCFLLHEKTAGSLGLLTDFFVALRCLVTK